MDMIVTRNSLITSLRRVGVLGSVEAGYFDTLFEKVAAGTPVVFEYSTDGLTGWSRTLNPLTHQFWRWSIDGGYTFASAVRMTPEKQPIKVGWLSYENQTLSQAIPGGVWTTIMNDGAGPSTTGSRFAPDGVTRMLETSTGRILFDELSAGDEVYIRHVVNVIPATNNVHYQFSHFFGNAGLGSDRVPAGTRTLLNEGGGVPTNQFLLDSHLFITDQRVVQQGMMPQIFVSNQVTLEYTGCYISVTRR